jgi:hypothetical protein
VLLVLAAGCTTAAPDPAPAVRPCRPIDAVAWRPVDLPGAGAVPGDLLPGPPWIAVGSVPAAGDDDAPAAWESADALTWTRVPTRAVSPDGAVQKLVLAARRGPATVALGVTYSTFEGRARPSAWRRTGGGWAEVPAERELWGGPRAQSITGLAAGPAGLVAVGARTDPEDRQVAGAWWSGDGASWVRPPDTPALTSADGEVIAPTGVAVGERAAVIVGDRVPLTSAGTVDGVAWTSADGRRWARAPETGLPAGPGMQRLGRVAALGDGFAAVGLEGDGERVRPAAWTSADGAVWRAAADPVLAERSGPPASTGIDRLVTAGGTAGGCLLATGRVGGAPRLWSSADGVRWAPAPLPPGLTGPVDGPVLVAGGPDATVLAEGRRVWTAAMP